MAVLVQLFANVNRDAKVRPQPFSLDEVLSWLGYPPEAEVSEAAPSRPTTEELREKLNLLHGLFGSNGGSEGKGT